MLLRNNFRAWERRYPAGAAQQQELVADVPQMMTSIKTIHNIINVNLWENMDKVLNSATCSVSVCLHYSRHFFSGYFFSSVSKISFLHEVLSTLQAVSSRSHSSFSPETLFSLTDQVTMPLNWQIFSFPNFFSHMKCLVCKLAKLLIIFIEIMPLNSPLHPKPCREWDCCCFGSIVSHAK